MAVIDIRTGLDASGAITAWDLLDINAGRPGHYLPLHHSHLAAALPACRIPAGAGTLPGAGGHRQHFARESRIDELAHAESADPLRFRLDHLADQRLAAVMRAAATRFGWAPARDQGALAGWGVAAELEKDGRVATCAEVRAGPAGGLNVIVTAYECGAVINPDTVTSQIEGGTIMALGGALFEQVILDHGRLASPSLAGYRVPRFSDVPDIGVALVDRTDIPSAGAGETPLIAVAPRSPTLSSRPPAGGCGRSPSSLAAACQAHSERHGRTPPCLPPKRAVKQFVQLMHQQHFGLVLAWGAGSAAHKGRRAQLASAMVSVNWLLYRS